MLLLAVLPGAVGAAWGAGAGASAAAGGWASASAGPPRFGLAGVRLRCSASASSARCRPRLGRRAFGGLVLLRCRAAAGAAADHGELGTHGHRLVLGDDDLGQYARGGRGDLGVDLVGGDLEQWLVGVDLVALLLEPAGDGAFGDALAERRHGHRRPPPLSSSAGPSGSGAVPGPALPLVSGSSCCGASCSSVPPLAAACLRPPVRRPRRRPPRPCRASRPPAAAPPVAVAARTGAVADDGELGADLDRLVLADDDLGQDAGRGEGISVSTLSVETSSSGSSALTWSPSCLSQRVTVPSETLSPRAGMVTEVDMGVSISFGSAVKRDSQRQGSRRCV